MQSASSLLMHQDSLHGLKSLKTLKCASIHFLGLLNLIDFCD